MVSMPSGPGQAVVADRRDDHVGPADPRVVGAQAKAEVELLEVEGHEVDEGRGLDRIERRDPALLGLVNFRRHEVGPEGGHEDARVVLRRIPVADRHAVAAPPSRPISRSTGTRSRSRAAGLTRGGAGPLGGSAGGLCARPSQGRCRQVGVPVEQVAHEDGDLLALPHVVSQQVDHALLGGAVAFDGVAEVEHAAAERRIGEPGIARVGQRRGHPCGPQLAEQLLVRVAPRPLDDDPRAVRGIEPQPCPAGILEVIGVRRGRRGLDAEQVPGPDLGVQVDQAGQGRAARDPSTVRRVSSRNCWSSTTDLRRVRLGSPRSGREAASPGDDAADHPQLIRACARLPEGSARREPTPRTAAVANSRRDAFPRVQASRGHRHEEHGPREARARRCDDADALWNRTARPALPDAIPTSENIGARIEPAPICQGRPPHPRLVL